MNENMGAKGGKQDRKRSFKIKLKNLERIKKKQKEKDKLKKEDIKTFFKIIPLVIIGESIKVIFENKEKQNIENPQSKQKKKEKKKKQETQIIEFPKKDFLSSNFHENIEKNDTEKKEQIKKENTKKRNTNESSKVNNSDNLEGKESSKEKKDDQTIKKQTDQLNNKVMITLLLSPTTINHLKKRTKKENETISKNKIEIKTTYLQFKQKNLSQKKHSNIHENKKMSNEQIKTKKLGNIMDIKLIDEYTKRLYEIRYSLKKLIYEYNNLVAESDDIYTKEEAETLLYKLNIIIRKIEQLKEKIKIEDIDKYDDSYIYNLVNEYLKEFEDKKFIEEIKDSDLYITLSEKIQELDIEKEKLQGKLELRKEKVESDEKDFEIIKREYAIFAKFDQDLIKFQNEQVYLLKELELKIENSLTITEKIETEVKAMNNQCKKLLELIALQMMIPKLKSTKNIITSTMIYMYYMRKILKPEIKTKKYKIIKIEDYSKDIENSLYQIDDTTKKLEKTTKKLREIIKEFEEKYKEYFDVIPECKSLLNNFKNIETSLSEKEYEIKRLKQHQLENLETNNEKVKRLNNKIENIPQKKIEKCG